MAIFVMIPSLTLPQIQCCTISAGGLHLVRKGLYLSKRGKICLKHNYTVYISLSALCACSRSLDAWVNLQEILSTAFAS